MSSTSPSHRLHFLFWPSLPPSLSLSLSPVNTTHSKNNLTADHTDHTTTKIKNLNEEIQVSQLFKRPFQHLGYGLAHLQLLSVLFFDHLRMGCEQAGLIRVE